MQTRHFRCCNFRIPLCSSTLPRRTTTYSSVWGFTSQSATVSALFMQSGFRNQRIPLLERLWTMSKFLQFAWKTFPNLCFNLGTRAARFRTPSHGRSAKKLSSLLWTHSSRVNSLPTQFPLTTSWSLWRSGVSRTRKPTNARRTWWTSRFLQGFQGDCGWQWGYHQGLAEFY